jgi:adenylate cyclase
MASVAIAQSDQEEFERAFAREILLSERRRVIAILILLAMLLVGWMIIYVVWADTLTRISHGRAHAWVPFTFLAPFVIYEALVLLVLTRRLRAGQELTIWARYLNAAIETSLPTAAIVTAAAFMGDAIAAVSSGFAMLYFIFIVTATLRLNPYLPLFTALVAAGEYLAAATWLLPISAEANDPMLTPGYHIGKAAVMLVTGIGASLLAREMRNGFRRAQSVAAARDHIARMFGQHVSPAVVDRLLNEPEDAVGERSEVCVMFLDIRQFTAAAAAHSPEESVRYLNDLFAFMIDAIDRHHGIINKFLGDGFMAVFGAPLADADASRNAVAAAREIVAEIARRSEAGTIWPTRVGIGIAAGPAVTGNVGSPRRKEFTVIGAVVNLAARLEQLTKTEGGPILVNEAAARTLADRLAEPLGEREIRGFADRVAVWRVAA